MEAIKGTNWEYLNLKYVLNKAEVGLVIETEIIMGINTLLDTISIAL
jgi:hypothetical protein